MDHNVLVLINEITSGFYLFIVKAFCSCGCELLIYICFVNGTTVAMDMCVHIRRIDVHQ